jgi:cyclase
MKKILSLIIVVLLLSAFSSLSSAQQRQETPVRLEKISDNLYQILGGNGANGVLVIDAKENYASVDKTIEEIKKITDKPIKYLVNTHSDGDHVDGDALFPSTVTFISQENCRIEMFRWDPREMRPFLPSLTFRDKMDIYLGTKDVQLWYFGVGHTTGDTVVYFPEEKTAFIGDQYFATRPQLIHSYKGGNSFEHVKTLEKMLATLDAEKFCSGHSDIAGRAEIKKHIELMKELQAKVKSLVKANKTLDEIKKEFEQNQSALVESIYNELKRGI